MELQTASLDKVLNKTLQVLESSKLQVFEICESARAEQFSIHKELEQIMIDLTEIIEKVDKAERDYRKSREYLSEVSRDFKRFNETDIQIAYDLATHRQLEVNSLREKEIHLRERRNDLQKRLRIVESTIERAETITSQLNVVLEYMSGDFNQVTRILESAKNRQLLGLKIILAQEEERKRIARDIHDTLAQSMANLIIRTEIAEKMMDRQQYDNLKDEIVSLKEEVRSGLEEVRKIIFNLRPMTLDDLGLVPTLRKFVQDFEEKHRIRTKLNIEGREIRLSSAMEVAIYRFVQECFSNILKHANASFVSLELRYEEQRVIITIHDNGVGFNPGKLKDLEGQHFGLIGMRERVELLEGKVEIQSNVNSGTKITMVVPVNEQKEG